MNPADLLLPPKFTSYRPGQLDCIMGLVESSNRFSLLSANTGAGKSIIYMSYGRITGGRVLILTGTKGLQAQLLTDFSSMGLVEIKGRGNYSCPHYGTCDEPGKLDCVCPLSEQSLCTYQCAVDRASGAEFVVANFAYWMSLAKYSDGDALGTFDVVIIDEAHTAPDWLADFCSLDIDTRETRAMGAPPVLKDDDTFDNWAGWLREVERAARSEAGSTGDKREKARLNTLSADVGRVAASIESTTLARINGDHDAHYNWAFERYNGGVKVSPVWAHEYAEEYLFRGIPRVVLCSATLSPSTGKYLGIPPGSYDYHETDSGFDPARRPFIYIPTTRVDYRMSEGQVRQLVNRIDAIIGARLDRKGIIHARSYARAKEIANRTRHKDLVFIHDTRDARQVIAEFKRHKGAAVLISPSVEEGYDFPGDECRYQVVVKVPFVDGRQPVIKARSTMDPTYTNYLTVQSLVQMAGRAMRSAQDACENFILDDHWVWFSAKGEFPTWFKRSWVRRSSLPDPMQIDDMVPLEVVATSRGAYNPVASMRDFR